MNQPLIRLGEIAVARSGDKGSSANIGVVARTPDAYPVLVEYLTTDVVLRHFQSLGLTRVQRFEMPNIHAINFILHHVLNGGGSLTLRSDAQGKSLGQALLELELPISTPRSNP